MSKIAEAGKKGREMLRKPTDLRSEEFDTRQMLLTVNRRMQKAAIMSAGAALAACVAVLALLPLKKAVPYIVTVNKTTGEVSVPSQDAAVAFNPSWINKAFFLRRWIEDLFTINQYLTVQITDPRAQAFLRGANAIAEFKAFRAEDQTYIRLAKDPTLVRNVKVEDLTPIAGTKNGAVANVELTTIQGGQTTVEHRLITLYWVIIPPQTPEDARINPIGIYVTDFKISNK